MEQLANNPLTSITNSGGISSSVTTMTVADPTPFPSTGNFRVLVDGEVMIVTGVSGSTFTITRGAESTSAASHAHGSNVYGILTKGALDAIVTVQQAGTEESSRRVLNFVSGATVADNSGAGRCDITISIPPGVTYGAGASRPAAGTAGRMYVPSDGIMSSIDTGSAWVGLNPGGSPFTIPPISSSGWTQKNSSVATITDFPGGGISVAFQYGSASNTPVWSLYRTLANGTSYSVIAAMQVLPANYSSNGRFGVVISDATKALMFALDQAGQKIVVESYTVFSGSTTVANVYNRGILYIPATLWFKVTNDGTHRTYYSSIDGIAWHQTYQETYNTFLVETVAGFGYSDNSNSMGLLPAMNLLSWSGA